MSYPHALTAQSTPSTSISASSFPPLTSLSDDFPAFPSKSATSFISASPASSIARFLAYLIFLSIFLAFFLDSGAAFLIAWLVRGVGFVILFWARRWVCCRLVLRVRAVLRFWAVGVLGLERDGIVEEGVVRCVGLSIGVLMHGGWSRFGKLCGCGEGIDTRCWAVGMVFHSDQICSSLTP